MKDRLRQTIAETLRQQPSERWRAALSRLLAGHAAEDEQQRPPPVEPERAQSEPRDDNDTRPMAMPAAVVRPVPARATERGDRRDDAPREEASGETAGRVERADGDTRRMRSPVQPSLPVMPPDPPGGDTQRMPVRRLAAVEPAGDGATARPLPHGDDVEAAVPDEAHSPAEATDSSNTSIQAILDNIKDAILTVDVDGSIVSDNPAARRVFGVDGQTLVGRSLAEFLPLLGHGGGTLESLCACLEERADDVAPAVIEAQRAGGERFSAEVTASKVYRKGSHRYVLCVRDVTDRLQGEQALRDSEARYRALVENAPEAIVVLDVDLNRFVDANDNACNLFKLSRQELLSIGPEAISPERQPDGLPSFGLERGYIDRSLNGGRPVFEWLHRDAEGREIPCEVRFIRLPSSHRRLIRASIIDIAARRRADTVAHGERRVLELIAANAPLERSLLAVVRLMEQVHPDSHAAVMLLDDAGERISLLASSTLPPPLKSALVDLPVGLSVGGCGAAASLGRQVVVRDVESEPLCGELLEAARQSGVRACCSTPIVTAGDRIHGTLGVYFTSARGPTTEELDLISRLTQLAGIALRRKQDEAALRASEGRFRALFDNVVDGVFQSTPDGELISANPALVQMLGYDSAEELLALGKLINLYVVPKERERLVAELNTNGRVRNFEYRLRRRNGSVIVVLENSRVVYDEHGRALYYEGTITDITERKTAERALFNEKERAQVTLKSIGDAVVTTDAAGHIEYLNPVAEQLTGWERRHAEGQRIEDIICLANDENGEPVENPVQRCLREGRVIGLADDVVLIARDGTRIAIQDSAAPIRDRSGQVVGAVMVFHDVSKERQVHRKLSYYASHDWLTGLINRREFEERLSKALQAVQQGQSRSHALLYLDLDQFKVVNDTCGHPAGDLLLRQLGDLLQFHVRGNDVLARLGGDEFAVLLADCTTDEAVRVADALREAIANFRFEWGDGARQVGVSIGIVPVDANSASVSSLLSAADVACYVAKDLGRNRIHVYEEGDASERHQEMQWVARINRAREEGRFELFYQPIVPIGETERDGCPQYELLLRMRDDRGQLVAPTVFIPAAERYNLMPSLDRWVVSQVLENLVFRGRGEEPYTLAINLSGTTLSDARFLDFLLDELSTVDPPPGALCFEITETAAIANLSSVVHFMKTLKARGCQLSLDDFGTGLSSLTYLKNLPVDYVKIDGQFIRNVTRDPADQTMVEAIARMARALKIKTIAERVESREVLKRLGEIGVAYAQGFFIAVPQSVTGLPVRALRLRA